MAKHPMKNLIITSGLMFSCFPGLAQAPAGYYATATGTGYTLKTQLFNIIKNHTDQGYAGLYETFETSDRDYYYENDGSVLDMYSENPIGQDPYNYTPGNNQCGNYSEEGDCYNREHIIPQSFFNQGAPMRNDAHFVTPSDGKVNGNRGNLPFGEVGAPTFTSLNGSMVGAASNSGYASGYSATVFEPIDEFKGDIARMYFYFATRYENVLMSWGGNYAMFDGSTNQVFTQTFKNILLVWNQQDPVSPREIARNNAIYARQGNRNPYIDNNAYVNAIWGAPLSTPEFGNLNQIVVYPNPSRNNRITFTSTVAIDEIYLADASGRTVVQISHPRQIDNMLALENIPAGFYMMRLYSGNQSVARKIIIQ